jgi:hypothetical protein
VIRDSRHCITGWLERASEVGQLKDGVDEIRSALQRVEHCSMVCGLSENRHIRDFVKYHMDPPEAEWQPLPNSVSVFLPPQAAI